MTALDELENNGLLDFMLIRDDELREWWGEQKEKRKQSAYLKSGWSKLTQEERLAITEKLYAAFKEQQQDSD